MAKYEAAMIRWKQTAKTLCIIVALAGFFPQAALAQSVSPSYRIDEAVFGSGGQVEGGSENYGGRASLGDLGVGNSQSDNFQAYGGFATTDEMYLEFIVDGGLRDFGELTTTTTGTATAGFSVRSYLSSGYEVMIKGSTPTNLSGVSRPLAAMTSTNISQQGTEQFGVNVRDNSFPDIGVDPIQDPDATFSFGAAATGYNITNQFKYVEGDTIAYSNSSSGRTDFVLSMIANVGTGTPGGAYETSLSLVVVPTF